MATPFRDGTAPQRVGWITFGLVVINCFVFLVLQPAMFQGDESRDSTVEGIEFMYRWAMVPCEVRSGEVVATSPEACDLSIIEELRTDIRRELGPGRELALPQQKSVAVSLFTSMFLHGNIIHLAGNMLFLWVFGRNVEDRLGWALHLGIYLVGGLAAGLSSVAASSDAANPHLGASGAIAATMGAYLILHPKARVLVAVAVPFQVVYIQAAVVLLMFFITQFFIGSDSGIAWEAHAGGMVAGALLTLPLLGLKRVRDRKRMEQDRPSVGATTF